MTDAKVLDRVLDRCRGALLGMAIGDALGTTNEFSRMNPNAPWSPLLTGPLTDIKGEGPFRVMKGQVTDDTMMACCLARSLKEHDGFDSDDAAQKYFDWYNQTFDCGSQTRASLITFDRTKDSLGCGKEVWIRSGKNAAGNGSLMRTTPIGVFFRDDLEAVIETSIHDSNITHFDFRCSLACAAFNAAVRNAVMGGDASSMMLAAYGGIANGARICAAEHPDLLPELTFAEDNLHDDLERSLNLDPWLYSRSSIDSDCLDMHGSQGFVRVAFRLAFWELNHTVSFKDALIDCVNRGADSDTNGAICGGLLGALYGEAGIPAEWVKTVLECDPPSPFHAGGGLHPNRLLEMLQE